MDPSPRDPVSPVSPGSDRFCLVKTAEGWMQDLCVCFCFPESERERERERERESELRFCAVVVLYFCLSRRCRRDLFGFPVAVVGINRKSCYQHQAFKSLWGLLAQEAVRSSILMPLPNWQKRRADRHGLATRFTMYPHLRTLV